MWTADWFPIIAGVLAAECLIFLGFLGWLLVGLYRQERREAREDAFRDRLVELLETTDEPEHSAELEAVADEYPEDIVRDVLLEMIQRSDPPVAVPQLVDLYRSRDLAAKHLEDLESNSQMKRLRALRALVGVARPEDMEEVRNAVVGSNVELVIAGKIAADVGTPEDVVDIFRRLELESRLMEEPVYGVLESMEHDAFARVFAQWDAFDSPGVRRVLLRVAADLGVDGTLDRIRTAARSDALELQTAACDAAARLHDPETLEIIVGLLENSNPAVRARAATALGEHDPDGAIEPLCEIMTDSEFWVRQNAAASLRRLGPDGVRALRELADQSEDRFAVDTARQELARLESSPHEAPALP